MTPEEKANKKEARKLINLPIAKRPDNVKYTPASTLEFAKYIVFFGETAVCFQHDGKRLYYLGEHPASSFNPDLKRNRDTALPASVDDRSRIEDFLG